MEEIRSLKARLLEERPVAYEEFPDIALYMDQIISYMPRQLIRFCEDEKLTSAMVNNYMKEKLLPRADGKRYHRIHLVYLTAICALKQVLSVRDIHLLLDHEIDNEQPEVFYKRFSEMLDRVLSETAESIQEDLASDEIGALAVQLALRSYADRLACERLISIMRENKNDTAV